MYLTSESLGALGQAAEPRPNRLSSLPISLLYPWARRRMRKKLWPLSWAPEIRDLEEAILGWKGTFADWGPAASRIAYAAFHKHPGKLPGISRSSDELILDDIFPMLEKLFGKGRAEQIAYEVRGRGRKLSEILSPGNVGAKNYRYVLTQAYGPGYERILQGRDVSSTTVEKVIKSLGRMLGAKNALRYVMVIFVPNAQERKELAALDEFAKGRLAGDPIPVADFGAQYAVSPFVRRMMSKYNIGTEDRWGAHQVKIVNLNLVYRLIDKTYSWPAPPEMFRSVFGQADYLSQLMPLLVGERVLKESEIRARLTLLILSNWEDFVNRVEIVMKRTARHMKKAAVRKAILMAVASIVIAIVAPAIIAAVYEAIQTYDSIKKRKSAMKEMKKLAARMRETDAAFAAEIERAIAFLALTRKEEAIYQKAEAERIVAEEARKKKLMEEAERKKRLKMEAKIKAQQKVRPPLAKRPDRKLSETPFVECPQLGVYGEWWEL